TPWPWESLPLINPSEPPGWPWLLCIIYPNTIKKYKLTYYLDLQQNKYQSQTYPEATQPSDPTPQCATYFPAREI
ncbi:hypothetical protein, partial [Pseudomonas monteilii]